MDSEQARARVHDFLCQRIEISACPEPPASVNLYDFDPSRENLFTFSLFGHGSVEASEYIAVDRESGNIRYLGFHGE